MDIGLHRRRTARFVDVSTIPLAAIDRVEILTDGASAVYGSDAVAGVVNFILRKDYQGQEVWANYAPTFDGSRQQETMGLSAGRNWGSGNAVATLQYQKQDNLSATERSYTNESSLPTDLLPKTEQYSGILNLNQDLGAGFDLSSDLLFSHKTVRAALTYAPTGNDFSQQNSDTINSGALSIDVGYKVTDHWRVDASTSYSRETTAWDIVYNINRGCPDGTCQYHDAYSVWSGDLDATGVLYHLPGGDVKLAFGGAYRNESVGVNIVPPTLRSRPYDRHVFAEYAELEVPLVSGANALPLVQELVASAAIRHDDYSDFGSTTNPRYGIAWKPIQEIRIRGAYSTSFRAPTAFEALENSSNPTYVFQLNFPSPAGSNVPVFFQPSGGPPPGPERSRNITAGLDFEPVKDKGLKVSADYFDIRYSDRIVTPNIPQNVLSQLSSYAPLVTTFSSSAAAQAYVNQITSAGGIYLNASSFPDVTGVQYLLKDYELNAAIVKISGFDLALSDRLHAGANEFRLALSATYLSHIETSYSSSSVPTDLVNTYANPLHWRARSQLTWLRGEWSATGAVNYSGHYEDTTVVPFGSIASWTTVDAQLAYAPASIKGLTVSLSAINIFNRDPPYVVGTDQLDEIHYDVGNGNPLGRQVVLGARFAW